MHYTEKSDVIPAQGKHKIRNVKLLQLLGQCCTRDASLQVRYSIVLFSSFYSLGYEASKHTYLLLNPVLTQAPNFLSLSDFFNTPILYAWIFQSLPAGHATNSNFRLHQSIYKQLIVFSISNYVGLTFSSLLLSFPTTPLLPILQGLT